MARNIEIKACITSVAELLARAQTLAGGAAPELIHQDDSFFTCTHGRLKLRTFADGSAELIHYQRSDSSGPKLSDYVRVPVPDAEALRDALTRALGSAGRVRKRRLLLHIGQTRVHLDTVEGLGEFLELEVVLNAAQSTAEGQAIAEQLLQRLGVARDALIAGAYVDLLPQPAAG